MSKRDKKTLKSDAFDLLQKRMTEAVKVLQEASEILKHEPDMEKGGLDEKLQKLAKDLEM